MFCCLGKRDTRVCPFCHIKEAVGERWVTETEDLVAFQDRSPSAQLHLLVIPKNHIKTVKDLGQGDIPLLQQMIELGRRLLKENGFNPDNTSQTR
ncbi:HIT-like domain-containing protein [Gilbertella persicaria]|uniref:HIT-like domain-containing protein n=1 Tax=Gilbertella persicaria TaxID=101096 RepID=UPI00221FC8C5|nr:HIT-like domain-containing protein [Gilbertella persicaria]KAI8062280.1 HIT-like domain-containing protein [Gilbertella persicaria]